jgi:hypothetical protein
VPTVRAACIGTATSSNFGIAATAMPAFGAPATITTPASFGRCLGRLGERIVGGVQVVLVAVGTITPAAINILALSMPSMAFHSHQATIASSIVAWTNKGGFGEEVALLTARAARPIVLMMGMSSGGAANTFGGVVVASIDLFAPTLATSATSLLALDTTGVTGFVSTGGVSVCQSLVLLGPPWI